MRTHWKWKALGGLAATALLASGLTAVATADDRAHVDRAAANGVPAGFSVTHSSWASNDSGLVVGNAPCDGSGFCELLLATNDGGNTWKEQVRPDIGADRDVLDLHAAESDGGNTRLALIGQEGHSMEGLYASYDGETWQPEKLGQSGAVTADVMVTIGEYVYVYGGSDSHDAYRAPIGEDKWERVDELGDHSEIAGRGDAGMVWDYSSGGSASIATTTDGTTWTERPQQPCADVEDSYRWGAVGSAEAMYLLCDPQVGKASRVFASDDAGETFSEVGTFTMPDRYHDESAVAAVDDTIAVGYRGPDNDGYGGGCFLKTSFDGGRTWERTLAVKGAELQLEELEFTDAEHGTAKCSGHVGPGGRGTEVYRTTDGGHTWQPVLKPGYPDASEWLDPVATSWTSPDNGAVLGWRMCAEQSYCASIVGTTDGGATWTERPAPKLDWIDEYDKRVGMFFTGKAGSAVGLVYAPEESYREKKALASYDGGQTWQTEDFGITGEDYWWVEDVTATESYVYATVNLGASGDDYTTTLFRTPIGEDQWERVDQVTNNGTGSAVDARGDTGVAFVQGNDTVPGTLWTTGDGEEWTKQSRACGLPRQIQQYRAGGTGQIYAFCGHDEGAKQELFVSDDDGATFTKVGGAPISDGVTDSAASGDSLLVAGDSSATGCVVGSSTDGGESWTANELKAGDPNDFGDVAGLDFQLADDQTGTVLCASLDVIGGGVVHRTTDGGKTWEPLELSTRE